MTANHKPLVLAMLLAVVGLSPSARAADASDARESGRRVLVAGPNGPHITQVAATEWARLVGVERYVDRPQFPERLQRTLSRAAWRKEQWNEVHLQHTIAALEQDRDHTQLADGYRAISERRPEWEPKLRRAEVASIYTALVSHPVLPAHSVGVFAAEPIAAGSLIGQYAGEVKRSSAIPRAQRTHAIALATARIRNGVPELLQKYVSDPIVVDGVQVRNEMPNLNHSATPNVAAIPVFDGKNIVTAFFAIKPIAPNEQLFVNYGAGYWPFQPSDLSQTRPIPFPEPSR